MHWYDVYRADGSITRVEADSKSLASQAVRYAGEAIQKVIEVAGPTASTGQPSTAGGTQIEVVGYTPTGGTTGGATGGTTGGTSTTTTTLPQPTLQQMTDNATGWSGTFGVPGYVGGFVGVTPGTPQAEWDEYTRYVAAQEQYPNVLPPAPNINEYENIRAQFTGGGTPSGGTPSGGTPSGGTPSGGDEGFDYRQWALDFYKGHLGAGQEAAEREHYESPMYYPAFTDWVREQGDMSGAFRGFVEQKYPSLAAQHQYDVGHLTGFPSEEEALAGAQGIEQAFQGWLTEETPALYQEYMGQRPYARGERYADYSPTTRLTNW